MKRFALTNGVKYVEAYAPRCVAAGGEVHSVHEDGTLDQATVGEVLHEGNAWFVDHIEDARLFKTRRGAEKARDSVPTFNLRVIEVDVIYKIR